MRPRRNYSEWLFAWWDKREKFMVGGPRRPDMRYLCDVLSKEVIAELDARGYDVTTLRFEIRRKPKPAPAE